MDLKKQYTFVMGELEKLGKERLKKRYLNQGAREPLFGVATGEMKPLLKQTGKSQALANRLYQSGNYDAMYFAGMIAEPDVMTRENFNEWMENAYFYMVSDYIVAVSLAEAPFAQELADEWIDSPLELYNSAGWSCYEWLLGVSTDDVFDKGKLLAMLKKIEASIETQPDRVKLVMNNFVVAVAVSYLPLHNEAMDVAKNITDVEFLQGKSVCKLPSAKEAIQIAVTKNRLGFKRRAVRC